jgi:6-phosphofructokinase 1
MTTRLQRIGVLTSGGDSPGFNPCIRAVVRMALHYGWEPWGVQSGFEGLVKGEAAPLTSRSMSGIIGQGGTKLGSSRSGAFQTQKGFRDALRHIHEMGLDAVVVIGGDGSMRGASALQQAGVPSVGIPGTIENDIYGTDTAIGVDSALNTGLDAIDRIKDTASAHQQVFIIEMMGEKSGYLALMSGLAGGAEVVCVPEVPFTLEQVAADVADAYVRGKTHCIIIVSEGAVPHAAEITEYLRTREQETGFGARLTILGHIQRGGPPTAQDRLLGTRLGTAAVTQLRDGASGIMVGQVDGKITAVPLEEVAQKTHVLNQGYYALSKSLAR